MTQRRVPALWMVALMLLMSISSSVAYAGVGESELEMEAPGSVGERTPIQTTDQNWRGNHANEGRGSMPGRMPHPALLDPQYGDPAVMYGKVADVSLLQLHGPGFMLEETNTEDHDNDGINDLDDLDDDNDGIYDLIERFDGCFSTDPFDHDNDGVLDHVDWDDDNDGILEGPIDYTQGNDPTNVSGDRYVEPGTVHPWTGTAVGVGYKIDQNLWDHDNDGVPDEDMDASGRVSYDEDDDNDARIDQFTWPCDNDGDGAQDYFDDDDDGDGVLDWEDANPYDASISGQMSTSGNMYDAPVQWQFSDYMQYSGGLNFVTLEASFHPGNPAFTTIWDGDLDGDGIPNFLDADGDNDENPNNIDADDDNDGLLDMWDPDDDNDGIRDVCWDIDVNGDGLNDYTQTDTSPYQTPGADTDGIPGIDCELDYDWDSDNDRWRPFDLDYDHVWDWFDVDLGGTPVPDNPLGDPSWNTSDRAWDLDNDNIVNENDSYPMVHQSVVNGWNCEWNSNYNPANPSDSKCLTERSSYTGNNDWDGDGVSNWDDVDDDNDGIPDYLDIDWDCDLDNDNDIHQLNGSRYRDDGPNDIDTDIDGDGLPNDEDWDDDNDGIPDLFDPDDGNCGVVDSDPSDSFYRPWYPLDDTDDLDGSTDSQRYTDNSSDHWNITFLVNPFVASNIVLDYNGYDATTNPPVSGTVPEFWWIYLSRWSAWNGDNKWDIDGDGDALQNGLDVDQDGDGMPDWWDQDEGNDGILDVDDPKMGGTLDSNTCGYVAQPSNANGQAPTGLVCGLAYAMQYGYPLNGFSAGWGLPFASRPDSSYSDGPYDGANSAQNWQCSSQCYHFEFGGSVWSSSNYSALINNRDLYIAWVGMKIQYPGWSWNFDLNGNYFPDEFADHLSNDVDPDDDCAAKLAGINTQTGLPFTDPTCMFNDTADLDDDFDSVYDHFDADDDNDGLWDFFEVDTNNDWDDDAGTEPPGAFFIGINCVDGDDDGTDTDPDADGWYQAVWDQGRLGQGLLFPRFYDVDNDNDGVPDGEDWDDDNDGISDVLQEMSAGCFWGEEQSIWDHDDDGIVDWMDDDWDADGRLNAAELATATPFVSPWDHDNDGIRDDEDLDDDEDGMKDEDEIMLWPTRYGRNSTNPWDHDDYGNGEGLYNSMDASTGPDVLDNDDDNDTREDLDYDILEEGHTSDPCYNGSISSDWDHDNDCIPDKDDKVPTHINITVPQVLWIDAKSPAIFHGYVEWLNMSSLAFEPAPNLPVQVHIEWTQNGTTAIETIDVLTDAWGGYTVGQFLYPESIHVGDNSTYTVYAEVTEMFIHDSSESMHHQVAVHANLTLDYVSWTYFRSDEQPLWLDFKAHYAADWDRGIFGARIVNAPMTFSVSGGPFGNRSTPTNFTGYGFGFRADSEGWCSLTFVQAGGIQGNWMQVRWNSTMDNGPGMLQGGYEEIIWDNASKSHNVIGRYNYTTTSLPVGDYEFVGRVDPPLASEWPFPYLVGDQTDPFMIRAMHRMYVEADIIVSGKNAVYYWDSTQFTGSTTFGAWRALFLEPGLAAANLSYSEASMGKPWAHSWDGNPSSLLGEAARLRPFLRHNGTHWYIAMQNGGDFDVPPCGPVDPDNPGADVRCEIIPEMNTGESFRIIGNVTNRTLTPWPHDPMALQVDLDHNGIFQGAQETGFARKPVMIANEAVFDYNWSWYSQYASGTYGVRVDFTNSNYYFTGNQTTVLAPTGAYVNLTVVGTTDFQLNSVPRLYRNMNATVEARLVDNALQPVSGVAVNWSWSASGMQNASTTDTNGVFKIPLNITADHELGNFTMTFEFPGSPLLKGSRVVQDFWVVSRTHINLVHAECAEVNVCESGDLWEFTAQVTDDNRTPSIKDIGAALDGAGENGGKVQVIFEGIDFDNVFHRQVVAELNPNAGIIHYERVLNPQLLIDDPASFLPDGFGPVNIILRFEENLPHEGCPVLEEFQLALQGAWDPCIAQPANDHFRRVLNHNVDGFSLIGRTSLLVDEQIVYTSEIDPATGAVIEKPMVITGQLRDELDNILFNRQIRVFYEMQGSSQGPVSCDPGTSDVDGNFSIVCPLSGVLAGQARVTVEYNAWENNDRFRYKNASVTHLFPVFSNSTLEITEAGPFKTDVDRFTFANGTSFSVLYLKESFHIEAMLKQSNGQPLGGKCVNIYLNPLENTRPIATAWTSDEDGSINWFSGDPEQNPSRKGVEPIGNELEGFRTLRVAYEPAREVSKGCDQETSAVVNGSYMDLIVLVRSKVDLSIDDGWEKPLGYQPGEEVTGGVAVIRNRIEAAVAGQQVHFLRQYWNGTVWVNESLDIATTNDRGIANFSYQYTGTQCGDETCDGTWRVIAHFPETSLFAGGEDIVGLVVLGQPPGDLNAAAWWTQPNVVLPLIIALLFAMIISAVMYKRYAERRRIEILRGILMDTMMQLQAANEYIQVIFNCYKDLVRFFRSHGFMKKVYETTREFEWAVREALTGIASTDQLDSFLSIFEEARYSDHTITVTHRDGAIHTLQAITTSIDMALGDQMFTRTAEHDAAIHTTMVKAGQFVTAEGEMRQAGIDEDAEELNFSL